MKDVSVAIWMVTYNHEDYIEQAVESVMNQKTDFNFKLFIGDDASTDTTRDVLIELKNKYPDKIDLTLNETNLGPSANAFKIYDKCYTSNPKYVALLEGDDYWTDILKLQRQVDFLEANKAYAFSMTRFLVLRLDKSLKDKNERFFKDDSDVIYDFDMFTKGWYGGTLTLVFRASAIRFSVSNSYKYFRDVHIYTELLKNGNGICQNFVSAVYRIHDKGLHNSLTDLKRAKISVLCYQELLKNNRGIPQIQKKYRYFHSEYIKNLLLNRKYYKAVKENIMSTLYTSDFFLFKKEFKRIVKYKLFKFF